MDRVSSNRGLTAVHKADSFEPGKMSSLLQSKHGSDETLSGYAGRNSQTVCGCDFPVRNIDDPGSMQPGLINEQARIVRGILTK